CWGGRLRRGWGVGVGGGGGVVVCAAAAVGQFPLPADATEERHPEFAFEGLDALADGRLGEFEATGSCGEAAALGGLGERLQVWQFGVHRGQDRVRLFSTTASESPRRCHARSVRSGEPPVRTRTRIAVPARASTGVGNGRERT